MGYVNKLNELIIGTEYEDLSLKQIIHKSNGPIFNNAAQIFNHDFYWNSLTPKKTEPSVSLLKAIEETFGSFEAFKEQFTQIGINCFGSGRTWLVLDEHEKLTIEATSNAHTPIEQNLTPLLVCDVWEHAYYIDQRNLRAKYIENFFAVANWDNASKIFKKRTLKNFINNSYLQ